MTSGKKISRPRAKATPGGLAAPSQRRKSKDLAWPLGISRKAHFDALWAKAQSDALAAGKDELHALALMNERMEAHPDAAAAKRISEALEALHLDPALRNSPGLSHFVFLMRELITDFLPGMSVNQMLEPLRTVLSHHGGGAKAKHDHDRIRHYHASLTSTGDADRATTMTAEHFGISTRMVRKVLED